MRATGGVASAIGAGLWASWPTDSPRRQAFGCTTEAQRTHIRKGRAEFAFPITKPEEEWPRDHWEQIVQTMIERTGLKQLCEVIESVVTKMREDEIVAAQDSRANSPARPSQPSLAR